MTPEQAYSFLSSQSTPTSQAPKTPESAYAFLAGEPVADADNPPTLSPELLATYQTDQAEKSAQQPGKAVQFLYDMATAPSKARDTISAVTLGAVGHLVDGVETLVSGTYRGTETGLALKKALGDESETPHFEAGKAIIEHAKSLQPAEWQRMLRNYDGNQAQFNAEQKRLESQGEFEGFWGGAKKIGNEALHTLGNVAENPAVIGRTLETSLAPLAIGAFNPWAGAAAGAAIASSEVLKNNQQFLETIPQYELDQSPYYNEIKSRLGLSDGEARYYIANNLAENGWNMATAAGVEFFLERFALGKLFKPSQGAAWKSALSKGAIEAGTELPQELTQTYVGNDAVIDTADRLSIHTDRKHTDGMGEAAILAPLSGFAVGSAIGGVTTAPSPRERFNNEVANEQQETSENNAQPTAQPLDQNALNQVAKQFEQTLGDEATALKAELKSDIENGNLAEAMQSQDRDYATIARAYAQAVGFEAQNALPTENAPSDDNLFTQIKQKIVDFVGRVRADKSLREQVELMPVSDVAVQEAAEHGLDIAGFTHLIDSSSVNHIFKHHGNEKTEQSRGQIAVTDADFGNITDIITTPDMVVYGEKTNIGRDAIFYIKKAEDGSTLVVEEVRQGKKKLALTSMRKYPPTTHATSILKSLSPNVQNDFGGSGLSIVQNPKNRNKPSTIVRDISGYKQKSADGQRVGFDTTEPTHSKPTLARQGMGAAEMSLANTPGVETVSELDGNKVSLGENQTVNQSRGATTSDLHTTSPIRSRTDMGASDTNNVSPTTQDVNSDPEIQQAKAILEKALGKAYADQVNFVRSSDFNDGRATAEGFFQNGKVHIVLDNIYSNNTMNRAERMAWVAWHELAHNGVDVRFKGNYEAITKTARKNPVVNAIARRIKAEYETAVKNGELNTMPQEATFIEEALVELYAATKTGNWAEIESRYNIKVHRSWKGGDNALTALFERFANAMRKIVGRIIGKDLSKASTNDILGILKKIDQSVKSLAENSENQTASGDTRYSLNERSDSAFAKAVDDVFNSDNRSIREEWIDLGTTPKPLIEAGIDDLPMFMNKQKIGKIKNEHPEMTADLLKQIPKQLNNPVIIFKNTKKGSPENSYVIFTELLAKNGNPVIAAIHANRVEGGLELNKLASVYGRNEAKDYLANMAKYADVRFVDKQKAREFQDTLQLLAPETLNELFAKASIVKNAVESNTKFSRQPQELSKSAYEQAKANGKTELTFQQWKQVRSPEFKAWFGDWENDHQNASKIINPRTGEPLVVYHGTNAEFTIFERKKIGSATDYGIRGKGFYFSPNKNLVSANYGSKIMDNFLYMRNPFDPFKFSSQEELAEHLGIDEGIFAFTPNAEFKIYSSYAGTLSEALKNKGYDGVTYPRRMELVVFNPNQIKSATDNNGEFSAENDDIRFSRVALRSNNEIIKQASERLKRVATDIRNGANYISNRPIELGNTPDIFERLGVPQLPMRITEPSKLFQIVRNQDSRDHDISPDVLAEIPYKLQEPLAVFDSDTEQNAIVAVMELKDSQNRPVIAAVHINKKAGFNQINKVASIYGKDDASVKFAEWTDKGLLRYLNNEKSHSLLTSFGLQSPTEKSMNGSLASNVLLQSDIVNTENTTRYSRRPKSESLEKLRKAETIRITGTEIEPSEDLRQYKRNALEYGKKLREQSPFVNRDTGRKINLQRASLTEILQHDYKNPEHLQSVAAIPQIAENAIYIDTLPNEDTKRSDIKEFDYYLAGLNIGGKDYTVRMSVGESDLGDVYYDHKLTQIEKGSLLEARHSDNKSGVPQQQSAFDGVDDKRLLQILQDETSSESENTRYSRPPSVLEQLDSGEVYMPTEGILAAIKQGELKQAYLQSKDTLYESMVDETLPVDRWAEGMPIDPMTAKALISAKDRAEGIRMDLNTRVTEQFIRPVMKNLMALADKHNLDVLMAKHIAQYWYSARYSIEKNLELLQREEQAMKEAKKELADAKQKGDPDEIAKLARAERRATRKYKDRYHDVHLNNWQKGADGKYLISRKVGTAGGWSIPHARAIMAKAEQYIPAREIEAALKPLQDAVKWNIATNLAHGRISPAQAAEYRQKPHYVPLTGDPYTELHEMDNSSDFLSGAGSGGVNTARDHHLDGRQESEADGAIDAIMGMLDKTNANSGWSEFKFLIDDIYETALRDTLSNHPNLTLTQAKNEVYTRYGIRKQRLSGITRTSDKVIIRKFEGISYQYTLPDKVIDALIAGTTDSDGRAAWAFITTIPRNLTRWLARGVTQFTPTFALTNMISDLMDKGDLLMSEKITANGKQMTFFERAKLQMKLYANVPLSWKATTTFAFKGASALNNQRKMQRNLNRLLELGGISNYNTYLAQNRESLNKELQDMGKLHKKAFNATLTLVAGWNAIFDYTSSLAMFTTLTDAGVDEKQAATLVLNQMNFRKQGSFAKYGKPFYMFLNPSIQGTAKTVKSLKTRGGQAMFAFNLLVFFAIYAWAVSGADEDETGNDMMSNPFYPREIQLKLFGSELRIPIGFGQKQLAWGIVVNTIKAYEGQITYANAAANILSHTTKSLSPIAPSEVSPDKEPITWLINTFSPSIAKPFLQIGQNRNSFGTPIVNENRHNKLPVAYQGKPETAEFWKELAEQVYQNTEGKLNIHPEIYKHMFDSYRGILGSFGQYLSNQIENPALAERGKRERVLFLDRFYREVGDNKVQSMYYRAKEEMKPLLEQSELHKQQGTWNKWVTPEKRKRLKWYLDGESTLNKLYLEKSRLEKMRRLDRIRGTNQLSDERFSERVKLINSRIEKVQRQQIHEWRKMEGLRTTLPK